MMHIRTTTTCGTGSRAKPFEYVAGRDASSHGGVQTSGQDVYVNVVGGLKLPKQVQTLPFLACASSLKDGKAHNNYRFGEVGLSGEIRQFPNGQNV